MPNNTRETQLQAFHALLDIMDTLREQCPWDKKQTFESLQKLTIEEVYELVDAIQSKDLAHVQEELGDILLHLVFYARLGNEVNAFDIADVLEQQAAKMIRRHPHIYGDVKVQDSDEVKKNWEAIKLQEGRTSILGGVPNALPALIKAFRIQDKAKQVGFEWETAEQVWEKVEEEIQEFQEAEAENNQSNMEAEFGDVLFSLVNYARFIGIDPEAALAKTNTKFIRRFQSMEEMAKFQQQDLASLSLNDKEALWQAAKRTE